MLIQHSSATVNVLEFRNNIVYYTGGVPLTDVDRVITAHSNNIYFGSGGGTVVASRGTNYSATSLGAYEASASGADPMFVDVTGLPTGFGGSYGVNMAPNRDGLRLRAASPGVDRGIALPGSYASSINTIGRPAGGGGWASGAYKLGGQPPSGPTTRG